MEARRGQAGDAGVVMDPHRERLGASAARQLEDSGALSGRLLLSQWEHESGRAPWALGLWVGWRCCLPCDWLPRWARSRAGPRMCISGTLLSNRNPERAREGAGPCSLRAPAAWGPRPAGGVVVMGLGGLTLSSSRFFQPVNQNRPIIS